MSEPMLEAFYHEHQDEFTTLIHVVIALSLGGVIGYEREKKKRPAGFRTTMLVAAVATLLTDLSTQLLIHIDNAVEGIIVNSDPTRVMVAIIMGISFLGTGTIFRSENNVSGLTTAATLLYASVLGIAVALEKYFLAVALTVIVLIVLHVFRVIGERD